MMGGFWTLPGCSQAFKLVWTRVLCAKSSRFPDSPTRLLWFCFSRSSPYSCVFSYADLEPFGPFTQRGRRCVGCPVIRVCGFGGW